MASANFRAGAARGMSLESGKPMATLLYDISVQTFLQTVSAVGGVFAPPALVGSQACQPADHDRPGRTALQSFTPEEVNGWTAKDLDFQIGPQRLCLHVGGLHPLVIRCPTSISTP